MLHLRSLWLVFAVVVAIAARAAFAQDDGLDDLPVDPDIRRILDRGTLIVAQIDEDLPMVFEADGDGGLKGFDVDLARAMASHLGVAVEILRTADSYDGVIRQVALGEADLGISFLSRTPRRAKHVLFSRPYISQSLTVLINRVRALSFRNQCPTPGQLLNWTEQAGVLGVEAGSANAARVLQRSPDASLKEFDGALEAMRAVLAGEIAISLQGQLAAQLFLTRNPAARIRLRICDIGPTDDEIAVAVPPGQYGLLNWVNVFLDDYGVTATVPELIGHEGPWEF